ncbi:MAG: site-specific integrase, partial [Burkholderiaceae bacterium]
MPHFPLIDLEPSAGATSSPSGPMPDKIKLFHDGDDVPLVAAQTDSEIARAFLHHAGLAPPTLKSTKTELGRFLLWCQAHNRTLRQLRVEDLSGYKAFLQDPQPAADWVSATRWPRSDARWRPFSGALSDASSRQAFRVVKSLMTFATHAGYLRRNASSLVKNIKTPAAARVTRYLSETAINYVYAAIDVLSAGTPAAFRARMR